MFTDVASPSRLVQTEDEAFPSLIAEFERQSDEGKAAMFKMYAGSARFTIPESVLIASGLLVLLTEGVDGFYRWVEAQRTLIASELANTTT